MKVADIICMGGRRRQVVKLKVRIDGKVEICEVEPYSRKQKLDDDIFFCLDRKSQVWRSIALTEVMAAKLMDEHFKPRFPVDF